MSSYKGINPIIGVPPHLSPTTSQMIPRRWLGLQQVTLGHIVGSRASSAKYYREDIQTFCPQEGGPAVFPEAYVPNIH